MACEPDQGYAAALRAKGPLSTDIYTLGFGDGIKSCVLRTIAEIGGGYCGFIQNAEVVVSCFRDHAHPLPTIPSGTGSLQVRRGCEYSSTSAINIHHQVPTGTDCDSFRNGIHYVDRPCIGYELEMHNDNEGNRSLNDQIQGHIRDAVQADNKK